MATGLIDAPAVEEPVAPKKGLIDAPGLAEPVKPTEPLPRSPSIMEGVPLKPGVEPPPPQAPGGIPTEEELAYRTPQPAVIAPSLGQVYKPPISLEAPPPHDMMEGVPLKPGFAPPPQAPGGVPTAEELAYRTPQPAVIAPQAEVLPQIAAAQKAQEQARQIPTAVTDLTHPDDPNAKGSQVQVGDQTGKYLNSNDDRVQSLIDWKGNKQDLLVQAAQYKAAHPEQTPADIEIEERFLDAIQKAPSNTPGALETAWRLGTGAADMILNAPDTAANLLKAGITSVQAAGVVAKMYAGKLTGQDLLTPQDEVALKTVMSIAEEGRVGGFELAQDIGDFLVRHRNRRVFGDALPSDPNQLTWDDINKLPPDQQRAAIRARTDSRAARLSEHAAMQRGELVPFGVEEFQSLTGHDPNTAAAEAAHGIHVDPNVIATGAMFSPTNLANLLLPVGEGFLGKALAAEGGAARATLTESAADLLSATGAVSKYGIEPWAPTLGRVGVRTAVALPARSILGHHLPFPFNMLAFSGLAKTKQIAGAIGEKLGQSFQAVRENVLEPYANLIREQAEGIRTGTNPVQANRGPLGPLLTEVPAGAIKGALIAAPFAAGAQTPEEVGGTLAFGALAGGAHAGLMPARDAAFSNIFFRDPAEYPTYNSPKFDYGTSYGGDVFDKAHNDWYKYQDPRTQDRIDDLRAAFPNVEQYWLNNADYQAKVAHLQNTINPATGKTYLPTGNQRTRGLNIVTDPATGKALVLVNGDSGSRMFDVGAHEIGHSVYESMTPQDKLLWQNLGAQSNNVDALTQWYTQNLSGTGHKYTDLPTDAEIKAGTKRYLPGLNGVTQEHINDELGAETVAALLRGEPVHNFTRNASLTRRAQIGLGRIANKLGFNVTPEEAQTMLGFKPSMAHVWLMDKVLRDYFKKNPSNIPQQPPKRVPGPEPVPGPPGGGGGRQGPIPKPKGRPTAAAPTPTGGPAPMPPPPPSVGPKVAEGPKVTNNQPEIGGGTTGAPQKEIDDAVLALQALKFPKRQAEQMVANASGQDSAELLRSALRNHEMAKGGRIEVPRAPQEAKEAQAPPMPHPLDAHRELTSPALARRAIAGDQQAVQALIERHGANWLQHVEKEAPDIAAEYRRKYPEQAAEQDQRIKAGVEAKPTPQRAETDAERAYREKYGTKAEPKAGVEAKPEQEQALKDLLDRYKRGEISARDYADQYKKLGGKELGHEWKAGTAAEVIPPVEPEVQTQPLGGAQIKVRNTSTGKSDAVLIARDETAFDPTKKGIGGSMQVPPYQVHGPFPIEGHTVNIPHGGDFLRGFKTDEEVYRAIEASAAKYGWKIESDPRYRYAEPWINKFQGERKAGTAAERLVDEGPQPQIPGSKVSFMPDIPEAPKGARKKAVPIVRAPDDLRKSLFTPEQRAWLADAQQKAIAAIDQFPEVPISGVRYADGDEPFPEAKMTKAQVAAFFDALNSDKLDFHNPEHQKLMADALTHDVLRRLISNPESLGWYNRVLDGAMEEMGKLEPRILQDPIHNMIMRLCMAITSQNQKVHPNFENAYRAYLYWDRTGLLPTDKAYFGGGTKADAMIANFQKINDLIRDHGFDKTEDILRTPMSVRQIRDEFKVKVPGEAMNYTSEASIMLGPKIGSFYNNLSKLYHTLTADLWFTRTMNRMAGRMMGFKKGALIGVEEPEVEGVEEEEAPDEVETGKHQLGKLRDLINKGELENANKSQQKKMLKEIKALEAFRDNPEDLDRDTAMQFSPTIREWAAKQHKVYQQSTGVNKKGEPLGTYGQKTKSNLLSKNLDLNFQNLTDAPRNGTEREDFRDIMKQVQKNLAGVGIDITHADNQAVLWYLEQDLFARAKGRKAGAFSADYLDAAYALRQKYQGKTPDEFGKVPEPEPPPSVPKIKGPKAAKVAAMPAGPDFPRAPPQILPTMRVSPLVSQAQEEERERQTGLPSAVTMPAQPVQPTQPEVRRGTMMMSRGQPSQQTRPSQPPSQQQPSDLQSEPDVDLPAGPRNYGVGTKGRQVLNIILHSTDGLSAEGDINELTTGAKHSSAHYYVMYGGKAHHLVAEDNVANHAGVQNIDPSHYGNEVTIGIEQQHRDGEEPWDDAEVRKTAKIVAHLLQKYPNLQLGNVLGHHDVAPQHKDDPQYYPWDDFYKYVRGYMGGADIGTGKHEAGGGTQRAETKPEGGVQKTARTAADFEVQKRHALQSAAQILREEGSSGSQDGIPEIYGYRKGQDSEYEELARLRASGDEQGVQRLAVNGLIKRAMDAGAGQFTDSAVNAQVMSLAHLRGPGGAKTILNAIGGDKHLAARSSPSLDPQAVENINRMSREEFMHQLQLARTVYDQKFLGAEYWNRFGKGLAGRYAREREFYASLQ
jgi:N-acetyl-anhydromuramyl-L-alanine amidase AmpD